MTNSNNTALRTGAVLVTVTLAYNLIEAAIAIGSGIAAHSIALVGFGLDSVIELSASAVMLWHLRRVIGGADSEALEESEARVRRFIGITFLLLAAYILIRGAMDLIGGEAPSESVVGIILAIVSLIVMPLIAWGKLRVAARANNAALRAEAKETLACAWLSFALLVGLGANALFGWWWADPVAALVMLPWLVNEGLENIRGEDDEDDD